MFEAQLLNELREEFNITTAKHNKTIKILIKKYIRGEISKEGFINILKGFAREN